MKNDWKTGRRKARNIWVIEQDVCICGIVLSLIERIAN
jgi:hypothetical protein